MGAADAAGYALSIVEPFIDRGRQEVRTLVFPMRKEREELEAAWEAAVAEVAGLVREGKDVCFVTIGDPMLYSTFLYLYRFAEA